MQALAADTNAQQQTLVRLQKNTALACNDQLKELSTSLGHVRLQVASALPMLLFVSIIWEGTCGDLSRPSKSSTS